MDGVPRIVNVEALEPHHQGEGGAPEPDPRQQPHRAVLLRGARTRPPRHPGPRGEGHLRHRRAPLRQGFVGIREIVKESFRTIDQLSQSKELVTGLPTGFVDLDERRAGCRRATSSSWPRGPAMGKTSFCLNVAQYASASTGETVGSSRWRWPRSSSSCACSARTRAWTPTAAHRQPPGEGLGAAGQGLRRPLRLADLHRRLRHAHPARDARQVPPPEGGARPGLGGRDYLQLCSAAAAIENRQQEIASISRSLKGWPRSCRARGRALAALARARGPHRQAPAALATFANRGASSRTRTS
jgi:replicative DNA helicase